MEDPEASGGREAIPEENAAVLEKLEKNGAFATLAGEGGVADNSAEEIRKVLKQERKRRLKQKKLLTKR